MIGLGIDAATELAGDSNEELRETLAATSELSRSAMWDLRRPIDMGHIFEGRGLGRVLQSHTATFTRVTSVPAEMEQSGTEPPLPSRHLRQRPVRACSPFVAYFPAASVFALIGTPTLAFLAVTILAGIYTAACLTGDGIEAVRTAESLAPDVIIMDVLMPRKDGVEACREIMDLLPETRILMLTVSTEEDAVIQAVAAGATGYLQKYSGKEDLLDALCEVAAGRLQLPADIVRRVFGTIRGEAPPATSPGSGLLTTREREILTLFSTGKSYAQIAELRELSPMTIRNAVYRIQHKLRLTTKQEIVVWAVRNGLLDDLPPES